MIDIDRLLDKVVRYGSIINATSNQTTTPIALVNEMLTRIPLEVLQDVNATFCDFTCGRGTFLLGLFALRMKALEDIITDESDRAKIIVTNLYGIDIDKWQVKHARMLLLRLANRWDVRDNDLQISTGDATVYDFKAMKFDVIVGNPPFQSTEKSKTDGGSGTRSNLWPKMVNSAFRLVKPNGHMLMVTPGNWRRGGNVSCNDVMWSNQIAWFQSAKTPIDYFPDIGHSIDIGAWHVIANELCADSSLVRRRLHPKQSVALHICEKFFDHCEMGDLELVGFKGQRNYEGMIYKSPDGDTERPYRIAGTSAQVKMGYWNWSATKPLNYDEKKVVVCDSGQFLVGYDVGTYGTGDHTASYIVSSNEEADNLIAFLSSALVRYISLQFMQENALGYPANLFMKLPRALLHKSWREVFDFTDEEIALITSHAK